VARVGELAPCVLQGLGGSRGDRHLRAFDKERSRAGEADSLAAAGDEYDLALEFEIHDAPLPLVFRPVDARLPLYDGAVWRRTSR
jgi:hypothetical protein